MLLQERFDRSSAFGQRSDLHTGDGEALAEKVVGDIRNSIVRSLALPLNR